MRLDYAGAPTCAEQATFQNLVASRMRGRDPFVVEAPARLSVTLHRRGPAFFTAEVSLFDATGKRTDHRRLDARDCTELVESAALVASVWMMPILPPPEAPPPPPEPPEAPPTPAPEPPAVAVPEVSVAPAPAPVAPAVPTGVRVEAGAWVDFGLATRPLVGVKAQAEVRRGRWSLAGELRWDPSASAPLPGGGVASTMLAAGGLAGCVHREWHASFAGCLVGELGEIQRGTGALHLAGFRQTTLYAGGGAGVRAEIPLPARLWVAAAVDLLGVKKPGSIAGSPTAGMAVDTRSVGGIAAGVGAGLGLSF